MKTIEQHFTDLTEALRETTAALIALRSEGATAPPSGKVSAPAGDGLDDESAPAAKKAAKKAAKETPKSSGPKKDAEYIRNFVKNERDRLKNDVSAEAVAKHKQAFSAILEKFGADSLSSVKESDIEAVAAAVEAINVESSDDLEDDDLG